MFEEDNRSGDYRRIKTEQQAAEPGDRAQGAEVKAARPCSLVRARSWSVRGNHKIRGHIIWTEWSRRDKLCALGWVARWPSICCLRRIRSTGNGIVLLVRSHEDEEGFGPGKLAPEDE